MDNTEHPFIETIKRHTALLDKICRSFCGENVEDSEDLRQDILLNLWKGWKRWKPDHRPITWIYRVAMNTAISWKRHRSKQINTQPLIDLDLPQDSENQEAIEHLYSLIRQLPPIDQKLLQLYIDGWTGKEIAQMMQTSESNVTTRIARIKTRLKDLNDKNDY